MAPRPRAAVVAVAALLVLLVLVVLLRPSCSLPAVVFSVTRRRLDGGGGSRRPSPSPAPAPAPSPTTNGGDHRSPTGAPHPRGGRGSRGGGPAPRGRKRKPRLNLGERVGIALAAVAAAMQVALIGACLGLLARHLRRRQGKAREEEEAGALPSSSSAPPANIASYCSVVPTRPRHPPLSRVSTATTTRIATNGGGAPASSPAANKANLLDPYSIKHLLDDTVSEAVNSKGYAEDTRLSSRKLAVGAAVVAVALLAQFYPGRFPENRGVLLVCIALYAALNVVLQIVSYTKEKNAILFAYPPEGLFNSTGLVLSSKLPRLSDLYTLTIASADPQYKSSTDRVHFTKSVTKWFTKDGVLVEGLFWKDVEKLIDDYNRSK
ncbi:uncharacterized protein LOC102704678 [Oryza brachyantha]|uniref:uncharacterized protein LOC102704678 n=1 Tax=Oryza brachyantha TaxID=4533 RepID=UPI001ADC8343|nr:uncharacterized protein LOC102704678 [Oryza brachyantha]